MKHLASILSLLALALVSGCNKQEPKPAALPPAKTEPAKPACAPDQKGYLSAQFSGVDSTPAELAVAAPDAQQRRAAATASR